MPDKKNTSEGDTPRKMVLLADGRLRETAAKTAHSLIRYRPQEVVAVLDRSESGKSCHEVLGYGGAIPIVGTLGQIDQADTLVIGIAPSGGRLPDDWKDVILEAIARRMNIVSGLHVLLRDDPELVRAADRSGVRLIDVRDNDQNDVATWETPRAECLRIQTVGTDCNVGKMSTALELTGELQHTGIDVKFVATGQSGILVEGDGLPIDRVISDFVSGACEKLVLANQHHEMIVVEGQGSLFHPRYSCVTLGLLHGCRPDCLILCHKMGRDQVKGLEPWPVPTLARAIEVNELMAALMHPCRVIGIAINGGTYDDAAVEAECRRIESELGLPTVDPYRHGAKRLADAVLAYRDKL